jgi:4-hydroxy-tetrahydrodipicolinate synthase
MPTPRNFSGVISPVLTPFDENGNPDTKRFIAHAKWLLEDGCTALAPFGTTSEANSLGVEERMGLLEALIGAGIPGAKLMPGTGMCSVTDAARLTRHAVEMGAGGVLMLPPFYYKGMSDDGLHAFFADVIERVGDKRLRVYLYHIPPVAQVGISLDLIGRLVKAYPQTVVGLKDSSGNWKNTEAVLKAFAPGGFEVFPGAETQMLDALRLGGAGCISATTNVAARAVRETYDKWQGKEADALQARIKATRLAIQAYPVIPVMKALLAHYRGDPAWARVRPPFVALSKEQAAAAVRDLADKHGFKMEMKKAA